VLVGWEGVLGNVKCTRNSQVNGGVQEQVEASSHRRARSTRQEGGVQCVCVQRVLLVVGPNQESGKKVS